MDLKELQGKKTYIIIVATIAYALGGAVAGLIPLDQAIMLILGSLGLGGLRHGITTARPAFPETQAPAQGSPAYGR